MARDCGTHTGRELATPRTCAGCPVGSPVSLALSFLMLVVLLGCAHTPPSPLAEATQAQLGTIGVVAVPVPPEVDYRTPGRGGAGGAAIGVTKGVGHGMLGAVMCTGVLAYCAPCVAGCAMAVVSPYLAVRYAMDQAKEGVSAETIAASEAAIQAVLGAPAHEAGVQADVLRLVATQTRHRVRPLPDEGIPSAAATAGYKGLTAHGIDTVIEITIQRLSLQCRTHGHGGGYNVGRISAADLNPALTLVVTARTRVLTAADGIELYGHTRDYLGRSATFADWGASDGQLLREGLAQRLRAMAAEIVSQVFGVAVPPIPEPEAPATPDPERAPEPPAQPSASGAGCPPCE